MFLSTPLAHHKVGIHRASEQVDAGSTEASCKRLNECRSNLSSTAQRRSCSSARPAEAATRAIDAGPALSFLEL